MPTLDASLVLPSPSSHHSPSSSSRQIEYAKEAVKQGQTSIGLKSNTHVVSELTSKDFPLVNQKIIKRKYQYYLKHEVEELIC